MHAPGPDEELLLELLNSRPIFDGVEQDRFADDGELREWARTHSGSGSAREAELLRRTRDRLQAAARGAAEPASLAEALDGVTRVPELGENGVTWRQSAPPDSRLAARLVLAWAHIQEELPGRLRPCGNDECRLFLLDLSNANRARWCSMATCGNRMKARRHYRRSHTR